MQHHPFIPISASNRDSDGINLHRKRSSRWCQQMTSSTPQWSYRFFLLRLPFFRSFFAPSYKLIAGKVSVWEGENVEKPKSIPQQQLHCGFCAVRRMENDLAGVPSRDVVSRFVSLSGKVECVENSNYFASMGLMNASARVVQVTIYVSPQILHDYWRTWKNWERPENSYDWGGEGKLCKSMNHKQSLMAPGCCVAVSISCCAVLSFSIHEQFEANNLSSTFSFLIEILSAFCRSKRVKEQSKVILGSTPTRFKSR